MDDHCKYQQRLLESPLALDNQNALSIGLNNIFTLLGLQSMWRKTFYGLKLQVLQLRSQGEQIEALNALIQALTKNHFWVSHTAKWWYLMQMAVSIAQDLQLSDSNKICEPVKRLFKLILQAPSPWYGYHAAYSFVSLSLWSFQFGKTQNALMQVNSAIHADASWGYPEYLLGWYGLVLEGIDPVPHFVKAIQFDWNFFRRLKQDPLCQKFPNVLENVKKALLMNKLLVLTDKLK